MTFKTKMGTELPLTNLRGKEYLEVKYRLVWFREDHPDWAIETELIEVSEQHCVAKATVRNAEGRIMSTAHKYEDQQGFPDYREKAETGAIGRALAHVGYGTQFAPELEEGERIVDSPVPRKASAGNPAPAPQRKVVAMQYRIPFGKYKGKTIREVPPKDIIQYCEYLKAEAEKKGEPISPLTRAFLNQVTAFMNQGE